RSNIRLDREMQEVIDDEGQNQHTGPDHVLAGKGSLLNGLDGVLLRSSFAVFKGQLDAEPDVNTNKDEHDSPECPHQGRKCMKVFCIGVDASMDPSEDGRVADQMNHDEEDHELACDRHKDLSANR